jgi:hypothetical protein
VFHDLPDHLLIRGRFSKLIHRPYCSMPVKPSRSGEIDGRRMPELR